MLDAHGEVRILREDLDRGAAHHRELLGPELLRLKAAVRLEELLSEIIEFNYILLHFRFGFVIQAVDAWRRRQLVGRETVLEQLVDLNGLRVGLIGFDG